LAHRFGPEEPNLDLAAAAALDFLGPPLVDVRLRNLARYVVREPQVHRRILLRRRHRGGREAGDADEPLLDQFHCCLLVDESAAGRARPHAVCGRVPDEPGRTVSAGRFAPRAAKEWW